MIKHLVVVALVLLVELICGVIVMYSGIIDVSASKPEGAIRGWLFKTTM